MYSVINTILGTQYVKGINFGVFLFTGNAEIT